MVLYQNTSINASSEISPQACWNPCMAVGRDTLPYRQPDGFLSEAKHTASECCKMAQNKRLWSQCQSYKIAPNDVPPHARVE